MDMKKLDDECNDLQRKLELLKSQGRDRNDDAEYMKTLYTLRDKCRERTRGN